MLFILLKKNIKIKINFVKKHTIKKLNRKYRKKNKNTDILTFKTKKYSNILGEIFIYNKIKKNKKALIIHGILHLLEYDHNKYKDYKIMIKMEKIIKQYIIGMSGIEPPTITTSK